MKVHAAVGMCRTALRVTKTGKKEYRLQGNEQQQKAIVWNTGPALILAGPGSGKTFTIVERVRYLIEEQQIDPSQILVITFTKAAAQQMRDRFCTRMEGVYHPVTFGTFHAIFFHILRTSCRYMSGSIISEKEKREYLRIVFAAMNQELPAEEGWEDGLLSEIGYLKNTGKMEADFKSSYLENNLFRQAFVRFQRLLSEMGKLDLDDFAAALKHLFIKNPQVLKKWQERYSYILVDEFQDINETQYEAIRLLAGERKNLFVVGDDDQAIYGFRGSDPAIMQRFLSDYPQAAQIPLSVNYRCSPGIVDTAGALVSKNRKRMPKQIVAGRLAAPVRRSLEVTGGADSSFRTFSKDRTVLIGSFADRKAQVKEIATIMNQYREKDLQISIAAIYRTNTDCSLLAEALGAAKIPYVMKEKLMSPYAHSVCRDLLSYLCLAKADRSRQDFFRIMNKPCRYFSRQMVPDGTVSFSAMLKRCGQQEYLKKNILKMQTDISRMAVMDLYAAVNYVRKAIGYDGWLRRELKEEKYREAMEMADFFQNSARDFKTVEEMRDHITAYEESLKEAEKTADASPEGAVNLMTLHGSKGLEFDIVFLPDCNEGIVPHKKSMKGDEVEEERRMFYVGMTRAKEKLFISWVAGSSQEPGFPSRFLGDMGYREAYRV
ncbi:MAG: ATP-dependent helicase [Lachnospiraceae bacterium]|nr:ATP-dependent helicase [Lachnospiraceae bacterium]